MTERSVPILTSSYEKRVEGATEKIFKYYFAGSVRIAMRENGVITWILTNHLGSTTALAAQDGTLSALFRYTAFAVYAPPSVFCERGGELCAANGSDTAPMTDYQFTGQRVEAEIGLYYYVARFYDPALGRFISADTIIPEPGIVKAYDRYAYTNNNPVNSIDPSGHKACSSFDANGKCIVDTEWQKKPSPKTNKNITRVTQTVIVSFSLQPIKVMEDGESYSDFSGSGDPSTVIRPKWDNRKPASPSKASPVSAMEAAYYTTDSIGNASYVLFPHGNQIVTSSIQYYQTEELAYVPSPMLTDITITNNSQSNLHYFLMVSGEEIFTSSKVSVAAGETATFNISPITIPYEGLNVSVKATSACGSVCIMSLNPILFRGWTDFIIQY